MGKWHIMTSHFSKSRYVYILQYCTLGHKNEVFWGRSLFKGNELLDIHSKCSKIMFHHLFSYLLAQHNSNIEIIGHKGIISEFSE